MDFRFNPKIAAQALGAFSTGSPDWARDQAQALAAIQLFPKTRAPFIALETLNPSPETREQWEKLLQQRAAEVGQQLTSVFPWERDYGCDEITEVLWERLRIGSPLQDLVVPTASGVLSEDLPIPLGGVLTYPDGGVGVILLDYELGWEDHFPYPLRVDMADLRDGAPLSSVHLPATPEEEGEFLDGLGSRVTDTPDGYRSYSNRRGATTRFRLEGSQLSVMTKARAPSGSEREIYSRTDYRATTPPSRYQFELVFHTERGLPWPRIFRAEKVDFGTPCLGTRVAPALDGDRPQYLFFSGAVWRITNPLPSMRERFPHDIVALLVSASRRLLAGQSVDLPPGLFLDRRNSTEVKGRKRVDAAGTVEEFLVRFGGITRDGQPLAWTLEYGDMRVQCLTVEDSNVSGVEANLLGETGISSLGSDFARPAPEPGLAPAGVLVRTADATVAASRAVAWPDEKRRPMTAGDREFLDGVYAEFDRCCMGRNSTDWRGHRSDRGDLRRALKKIGWTDEEIRDLFSLDLEKGRDSLGDLSVSDHYNISFNFSDLPFALEAFQEAGWDRRRVYRFLSRFVQSRKRRGSLPEVLRGMTENGWPEGAQEELLDAIVEHALYPDQCLETLTKLLQKKMGKDWDRGRLAKIYAQLVRSDDLYFASRGVELATAFHEAADSLSQAGCPDEVQFPLLSELIEVSHLRHLMDLLKSVPIAADAMREAGWRPEWIIGTLTLLAQKATAWSRAHPDPDPVHPILAAVGVQSSSVQPGRHVISIYENIPSYLARMRDEGLSAEGQFQEIKRVANLIPTPQ